MMKNLFVCLFMLASFQQMSVAAVYDDWKPVSGAKALAFVERFYSFRSMEDGTWEDNILEQYLAPSVLQQLQDAAADSDAKYASWLLSATDDSQMIKPSTQSKDPVITDDGRVARDLTVFYWADTWLRATQTLYFTVKSKGGRMFITQVDNMNGEAAADVWQQLEARDKAREMEEEDVVEPDPLQQFDGKIGPFAITFFMNPTEFAEGAEVGHYYYNERPNSVFTLKLVKNEAVNAKGSMHIVLKEYTAKGNHTGTFDGQYECRGGGYEGTFTNGKGQQYHFELMESVER